MQTVITQTPEPGRSMVMFCGDTITFTLRMSQNLMGDAWIRTDLGRASVSRQEIVDRIDKNEIELNEAWHDIKMVRVDKSDSSDRLLTDSDRSFANRAIPGQDITEFQITLPLIEVGHFRAKCFFLEAGKSVPVWPEGENCIINIDSAGSCCANIIYNAFVRQFGDTKWPDAESRDSGEEKPPDSPDSEMCGYCHEQRDNRASLNENERHLLDRLDARGYCVIPPSGKFRDLIKDVEFIFKELGCRVLHLLPVHPTPTTYGRMGRYGSPYAALNFTEVDPALAEFDPSATPLEQFMELADAVHYHCGYLILDIAINHTGWASSIHESHPEWLVRNEDGTIEVPGAWGVKWEDLTRLDYSKKELWQYMADMFLLWCKRRVDGFRCDAGYMIPVAAWEYIVARVRQEYPDTLFFLEGLGGGIHATCDLLDIANLNWAYSELFQNYDQHQIENYLPESIGISQQYGLMVNFAETHDNPRLASVSHTYAMMRTSICALFSVCGSFGFAAGVEWFATQKINVHESPSLNWGAKTNQITHIQKLNHILRTHPTFTQNTELSLIHALPSAAMHTDSFDSTHNSNSVALLRYHPATESRLLILANLDCHNTQTIFWSKKASGVDDICFYNLIGEELSPQSLVDSSVDDGDNGQKGKSGKNYAKISIDINADQCSLKLMPGEVVALSPTSEYKAMESGYSSRKEYICGMETNNSYSICRMPQRVLLQKFRSKALQIFSGFKGYGDVAESIVTESSLSEQLFKNPLEFCRTCNPQGEESRVVTWKWGKDNRRTVMIPPGYCLMVTAPAHFRADIRIKVQRDRKNKKVAEGVSEGSSKEIVIGYEEGLPMENGDFFAIFMPIELSSQGFDFDGEHVECNFSIRLFQYEKAQEEKSTLLYLANPDSLILGAEFTRQEIVHDPSLKLLGFNKKGAMLRAAAWWGRLESRYDALLAANLNRDFPENRWILLARYRIWVIYQGYSRELALDCLERFTFSHNSSGKWLFNVPTCEGSHFQIEISLEMMLHMNCTRMKIHRRSYIRGKLPPFKDGIIRQTINDFRTSESAFIKYHSREHLLPDDKTVTIIIRPDVEDRSFHDTVKAWTGPEHHWRSSFQNSGNGFVFNPAPEKERALELRISNGKFVSEPEWQYMVYHSLEAERGLDPYSDLFSPGYFTTSLMGGETVVIRASTPPCREGIILPHISPVHVDNAPVVKAIRPFDHCNKTIEPFSAGWLFTDAVQNSLDAFIVERGSRKSVIAGYPWFLDWGRDSLIFCRALIESGRFSDAKDILRLFGSFEQNGTLPNMICGSDAGNRETSDAPLWFFAACRDLAQKEGDAFLDEPVDLGDLRRSNLDPDSPEVQNNDFLPNEKTSQYSQQSRIKRTFRELLVSMANSFIKGTDTGMGIDPETCLFYSPSHFTWMDTNFPAGSPRQGYPVEIQALWYSALMFLDQIDISGGYSQKTVAGTSSDIIHDAKDGLSSDAQLSDPDKSSGYDTLPATKRSWREMALDVQTNVVKLFYREQDGFFSDCLHCDSRKSALNAIPDDALRPNQLFLITLGLARDKKMCINSLESCMDLLVPGAIRSLADRKVTIPLYIYTKYQHGTDTMTLLNDPFNPYFGKYQGDEDTCRKPAYHNGTAWTWQFPVFCEAWAKTFGKKGVQTARAWLGSSILLMRKGCAGQIPEILDGDTPHTPRGCDAQAWGSSELARVWLKFEKN